MTDRRLKQRDDLGTLRPEEGRVRQQRIQSREKKLVWRKRKRFLRRLLLGIEMNGLLNSNSMWFRDCRQRRRRSLRKTEREREKINHYSNKQTRLFTLEISCWNHFINFGMGDNVEKCRIEGKWLERCKATSLMSSEAMSNPPISTENKGKE